MESITGLPQPLHANIAGTDTLHCTTLAVGMFIKSDELFTDMSNVSGIADDILIVGYGFDKGGHDKALRQVMPICHWEIFKLNKYKCHFRCTKILFFGEVIYKEGVQPDPKNINNMNLTMVF